MYNITSNRERVEVYCEREKMRHKVEKQENIAKSNRKFSFVAKATNSYRDRDKFDESSSLTDTETDHRLLPINPRKTFVAGRKVTVVVGRRAP